LDFSEQRPASAGELAAIVGLTPSATLYYVRKLHEAGLIEQVDSRQRRNRSLRQRVVGATTTNTSYGYSAANELCYSIASTATGTCAAPPSGATTYSYDGAGQRTTNPTAAFDQIQRMTTLAGTSLGYLSPGNGELVAYGTTNYQNNLLGLSRIIPPAGSATDIIRTPNGAPIAQRTGTSSKQALFTDALGSVLATADDGATSLSRHYSYDPDGNASLSGSGTDSVLRYAGGHPAATSTTTAPVTTTRAPRSGPNRTR
jgi:hypothetical protein